MKTQLELVDHYLSFFCNWSFTTKFIRQDAEGGVSLRILKKDRAVVTVGTLNLVGVFACSLLILIIVFVVTSDWCRYFVWLTEKHGLSLKHSRTSVSLTAFSRHDSTLIS
jgi:hypothetical protein